MKKRASVVPGLGKIWFEKRNAHSRSRHATGLHSRVASDEMTRSNLVLSLGSNAGDIRHCSHTLRCSSAQLLSGATHLANERLTYSARARVDFLFYRG